MQDKKAKLLEGLFETKAIRVCPDDRPFWYTSGKIGAYYVNTHFLYGSEEKANNLLKVIDEHKRDKEKCSGVVFDAITKNYQDGGIFKTTIDVLKESIQNAVPLDTFDYISGGERRDWFFSMMTAALLHKPHITIFKDMDMVVFETGTSKKVETLKGAKVLHIADIITGASSYERAWVPAIKKAAGKMAHSFVIVDRMQGGSENLERLGVVSHALIDIEPYIFNKAFEKRYISLEQYNLVLDYMKDPNEFMCAFFQKHPSFIDDALHSDEKTVQRAKQCIEKGYYPGKV